MSFYGSTFLKLEGKSIKGENGCIMVIGGSKLYTGAPIFSAKAALRSGADLAFILSSEEALISIKSLHEAAVFNFSYDERILKKVTALIVGPGLGFIEDEELCIILKIVFFLESRSIPIVIDADAIHYYKQGYFDFVTKAVITPNKKESINLKIKKNHICIYKGEYDYVTLNETKSIVFNAGSLKRCGGLGDILSGILATAVSINSENLLDACISGCELAREAGRIAFEEKGYSALASDILEKIPEALKNHMQNKSKS